MASTPKGEFLPLIHEARPANRREVLCPGSPPPGIHSTLYNQEPRPSRCCGEHRSQLQ